MSDTAQRPAEAFVRDAPTVVSYGTLGAYAFWLYAFGPAVALLRGEMGLSYSMVGAYSAAWSAGAIGAGAVFARAARLGRHRLLWSSAAGATAGAAVFTLTRSVGWTLAGAVLMGLAGTLVQATTQSVLADRHGHRRDRALVESNIAAGACAVLAPLALGGLAHTLLGWRVAMAVPVVAMAGFYVANRRTVFPAPTRPRASAGGRGGLGAAAWLLCLLVAVGIGVEFCVVYFGTELLTATTGLPATAAATSMTLFYAGILLGRVAGAGLTRRAGRTRWLLWGSLAATMAGLLALWLPGLAPVALAGLFLAGCGVANLFPLSLALAMAAAPDRTDLVNARVQLFGGVFVISAPFVLGALADGVGMGVAFVVTPVLTAVCGALLWCGGRVPHRGAASSG